MMVNLLDTSPEHTRKSPLTWFNVGKLFVTSLWSNIDTIKMKMKITYQKTIINIESNFIPIVVKSIVCTN